MMSGNPVIIKSDLEGSVSSSLKKGMESKAHSFPSVSGFFESKIIILCDDQRWKSFFVESLSDEAFSMHTLGSLFPAKFDRAENHAERLIHSLVLNEEKYRLSVKGGNMLVVFQNISRFN